MELNDFLDQIPQALSRLSVDLTVKWQSRAARDEFGDGRDRLCYQAHFGRDTPCPGCNVAEVIAKRTTQSWFLSQEKDGRPVYFEVIMTPVCDEELDAVRILVTGVNAGEGMPGLVETVTVGQDVIAAEGVFGTTLSILKLPVMVAAEVTSLPPLSVNVSLAAKATLLSLSMITTWAPTAAFDGNP